MDQKNYIDEALKQKREFDRERLRKYRARKREEAKQQEIISQDKQIVRSKSEQQKQVSRKCSRKCPANKQLCTAKTVQHEIHNSEIPRPSSRSPPPLVWNQKVVEIVKLKMDQENALERKRKFARERAKRYRERKQKKRDNQQNFKQIVQKEVSRGDMIRDPQVPEPLNSNPPPLVRNQGSVQVKKEINEEFIIKEESDIFETDLQDATYEDKMNDFCVKKMKEKLINEDLNILGNSVQDIEYEDTVDDFCVQKEIGEVLMKQELNEDVGDIKYEDTEFVFCVKEEIKEELNYQEGDPLEHCSEMNNEFQQQCTYDISKYLIFQEKRNKTEIPESNIK